MKARISIRHVMFKMRAEGANLNQAKPDESLRQKDPTTESSLWKILVSIFTKNTDGVKF
jgi:hypothetical protein